MEATNLDVLLGEKNGAEVVRLLLVERRQKRPTIETLGRIAKLTGMPSRAYVADILSGRRQLTRRYQQATLTYLGLRSFERSYVELLLETGRSRDLKAKAALRSALREYKKFLLAARYDPFDTMPPSTFEALVFGSFDLFGGRPRKRDLVDLFGRSREQDIEDALFELHRRGLIRSTRARYQATDRIVLLGDEKGSQAEQRHLSFLTAMVAEGMHGAQRWFDKPDQSCFQAFILSAKKDAYLDAVKDIKNYVYQKLAALESDDPDMLIQLNLQLFPQASLERR